MRSRSTTSTRNGGSSSPVMRRRRHGWLTVPSCGSRTGSTSTPRPPSPGWRCGATPARSTVRCRSVGPGTPTMAAFSVEPFGAGVEAEARRPADRWVVRRGCRARDLQLYVHLPADDLEGSGIATVEGLGAVTVARVEDWLNRHTAAGCPQAVVMRLVLRSSDGRVPRWPLPMRVGPGDRQHGTSAGGHLRWGALGSCARQQTGTTSLPGSRRDSGRSWRAT